MENAKPLRTPSPTYLKLSTCACPTSDKDKEFITKFPYQFSIGSLKYAMVVTRSAIGFAVGAISQFMSNPGKKHWDVVKLLLRYLSGTKDKCLCLVRGNVSIMGYTSGYIFQIMGGSLLGDPVSEIVSHYQLQRLSMLQPVRHVRKQFGCLD